MEGLGSSLLFLVALCLLLGFLWRWYVSSLSLLPGGAARAARRGRGSLLAGVVSTVVGALVTLVIEAVALLGNVVLTLAGALGRGIGAAWGRGITTAAGRPGRRRRRREDEDFARWERDLFS